MTQVTTTHELLRSRAATKMPGYTALEIVRPGKAVELWHVVPDSDVKRHVDEWAKQHGVSEGT